MYVSSNSFHLDRYFPIMAVGPWRLFWRRILHEEEEEGGEIE